MGILAAAGSQRYQSKPHPCRAHCLSWAAKAFPGLTHMPRIEQGPAHPKVTCYHETPSSHCHPRGASRQTPHSTLGDARMKSSGLVAVLPTSPLVAAAHGSRGGQQPRALPEHTTPENLSQPHGLPVKPSASISHGAHCVEMERVPASTDGKLQQQQKRRDHNYLNIMKGFIKYTWKTTQQPHKVKLLVSTLQTI